MSRDHFIPPFLVTCDMRCPLLNTRIRYLWTILKPDTAMQMDRMLRRKIDRLHVVLQHRFGHTAPVAIVDIQL